MATAKKCDICSEFYQHQDGYRLTWADAYDYDICSAACLVAKAEREHKLRMEQDFTRRHGRPVIRA